MKKSLKKKLEDKPVDNVKNEDLITNCPKCKVENIVTPYGQLANFIINNSSFIVCKKCGFKYKK